MLAQITFDTRLECQSCTLPKRSELTCGETAALALNPQPGDYTKQPSLRPTRSGLAECLQGCNKSSTEVDAYRRESTFW